MFTLSKTKKRHRGMLETLPDAGLKQTATCQSYGLFQCSSYNRLSGFASVTGKKSQRVASPAGRSPEYQPRFRALSVVVCASAGGCPLVKRIGKTYQVIVQFSGKKISLGPFAFRSQALIAEDVADKIRREIDQHHKSNERTRLIDRYKFREAMTEMKNAAIEPGF
jgi:hypothetical protein